MQRSIRKLKSRIQTGDQVSRSTLVQENGSISDTYTPLDFNKFIPWLCRQWSVEEAVVVKGVKEEDTINGIILMPRDISKKLEFSELCDSKVIEIRAVYSNSKLVEIAIIKCSHKIPAKVIRAISLCLPFHPTLSRLTIRHGGVTGYLLYEISKLLPHSNITHACFDDSFVPEGNFNVILKTLNQLTYLSLNRCRINDKVCQTIASRLIDGNPGAKTVRALELASNTITNEGVRHLATMLRSNRTLVHLNLADNDISDDGGADLVAVLKEFRLTAEEILSIKVRRLDNVRKIKISLDKDSFTPNTEHDTSKTNDLSGSSKYTTKHHQQAKTHKKRNKTPTLTSTSSTLNTANESQSSFSPTNIVKRDEAYYAKGNFTLCSLNLAYNNLDYLFLPILLEAIVYQNAIVQSPAIGLVRIVLDGNNLPKTCDELVELDYFLTMKIKRFSRKRSNSSKKSKPRFDSLSIETSLNLA